MTKEKLSDGISGAKLGIIPVKNIVDSIHELAGSALYDAGFPNHLMSKEELVEILRLLEDCREEGRSLYPEILLTTSLDKCLEPFHPIQVFICGECIDRPGRFRKAIKRCAAIAADPWIVVLEVSDQKLKYGVAIKSTRASAGSLYEEIFDITENANPPLIMLRRYGSRAVLMRSSKEERVISLTLSEELLKVTDDIKQFAAVVASDTADNARPATTRIVHRLLEQACREGHGFITCAMDATPTNIQKCSELFADGAWLSPPIDLSTPLELGDAAAVLESDNVLRSRFNLARQMVEVDLMTMFSMKGELLGYNIHIPSPRTSGVSGGGARSRAYAAILENQFVKAIFMCSQDGITKFTDTRNGNK